MIVPIPGWTVDGPISAVGSMQPRYPSANALSRDLRGAMVGWSHALADEISALQSGQSMQVHTLNGRATIAREI